MRGLQFFVLLTLTHTALLSLAENVLEDKTVIGIDLGTTYSCVAIYQGGRVDIIANDQGNRITPSWVSFSGNERLIGNTAKQAFHTSPSQTIFDAKRLIGRHFEDIQLREDIRHWPFKVVNNHGRPAVEVVFRGSVKVFTPQEISAMVLGKMKETAEAYLGRPVTQAVITVPAYFNDEQHQSTKDAGQIAGLSVLRIINEPTTAAIAYGLDKKRGKESKMVVYDLGGGTFDVSLLRVRDGVFEVLATAGDTHLGGEDFDNQLIDHFTAKYHKDTGRNVLGNTCAISKLKREVEKAKCALSSQYTTRLEIESFDEGADFSAILTRAKFEELNIDLFKRTLDPVSKVLGDSGLTSSDIDDVVLVGGSTRIPFIRKLLKDFFGGLEPRMGINPDEAVAYGAAIQGSILAGITPFDDMVLVDVCPFTLGIQTAGGAFSELIPRNTPIPVQKSEISSTATDNQRTVLIQVLQGDSVVAKDNVLLGTFKLAGIPPSARGVPQIQVTFHVDTNGILTVIAYDKDGNQLAKSDLNHMVHDAQMFAQGDQEARVRSGALNKLEEILSAKRNELLSDVHTEDRAIRRLLDQYSHWAEALGGSSSLVELNRRIDEVSKLHLINEAPAMPTSELDYPSDTPVPLEILDTTPLPEPKVMCVEQAESCSSTSVNPSFPPIFRHEL
ncbi:ATPase with role in protein import into the ER [Ceratobasidium sp. 394]|nr:ATPase with role in protein import into the ER [Ceratobasidium sp. 394]